MLQKKRFNRTFPLRLFAAILVVLGLVASTVLIKNSTYFLPQAAQASSTNTYYVMKVAVIKYFPLTSNKQNIDVKVTGDVGDSYPLIKQKTVGITNALTTLIPKATTYLGYKDTTAQPALAYTVISTKEYETAVPMLTDGSRKPNYKQIMLDHDICNLVENQGVREIWLWAYQGPTFPGSTNPYLNISESKMAGPWGDISNSHRTNDMPICKKTYRVYTFNYGRGTSEAIHSWGHQIEAEVRHIDEALLQSFQGPAHPQPTNQTGRCGSVHNPPNARHEYDWENPTPQRSDCLDWKPDGVGTMTDISCKTWGCTYVSDTNNPSLNYQIWNWQNMPGRLNPKTNQGKKLRNWWDVHGDFDAVMTNNRTLFLPSSTPTPTPTPIFKQEKPIIVKPKPAPTKTTPPSR